MKKFLSLICVLCLVACNSEKPVETNYSQQFAQTHSKTALEVINQAITDLNENTANEFLQTLHQKGVIKPADIQTINTLESIDQCIPETNEHSNAAYIGVCPVDDKYQMRVKIFDLYADFWSSGEISFEYITIPQTSTDNSEIAKTLETLLNNKDEVLNNLFGYAQPCEPEDELSYCTVTSDQDEGQAYIDQILEDAKTVYSDAFLQQYTSILFNGENPVWKLDENGLRLLLAHDILIPSYHYEVSTIGSVVQQDNTLIINLCVSYLDQIDTTVHQITLIDEGNGYRLLTLE